MRATFTIAVSLSICSGLLGCDQGQKASTPAPAVAAVTAPCACQLQAQAVPAPPAETRRSHRHRHHHRNGMAYEASWQQSASSVSSYAESHESDLADESGAAEQGPPAYPPPPPPPGAGSGVWIDGYGRSHYAGGGVAVEADGGPGPLSAEDAHRRADPWRGYNSKCNNAID